MDEIGVSWSVFLTMLMVLGCTSACPTNETEMTAPESQACQNYYSTSDCHSYRDCVKSQLPADFADLEPFLSYVCKNNKSRATLLLNAIKASPLMVLKEFSIWDLIELWNKLENTKTDVFDSLELLKKIVKAEGMESLRKKEFWLEAVTAIVLGIRDAIRNFNKGKLQKFVEKLLTFICECLTKFLIGFITEVLEGLIKWLKEIKIPFFGKAELGPNDMIGGAMSVVYVIDPSGATSTEFTVMVSYLADTAVSLATNGIRIGVVCAGFGISVATPLQVWQNTTELYANITGMDCTPGISATRDGVLTGASLLGTEGSRNIILFNPGVSDLQGTENATNSTKAAGINVYVVGIGDSVSEGSIASLASSPPLDYGVSIDDFSSESFEQIPLTALIYLTPQVTASGTQFSGTLGEAEVLSLQYSLPVDGLTLSVSVDSGSLFVYASYLIRNPTYITADFAIGGSGSFSCYTPSLSEETLYVSIIAATANTSFILTVRDGLNNMTTPMEPGAPENLDTASLTPREVWLIWDRPNITNGVMTEYTLVCEPENAALPTVIDITEIELYQFNSPSVASLNGLYPGESYNCSVSAANEVGYGPASSILIHIPLTD